MKTTRRILVGALAATLTILPTTAFALDDAATRTDTATNTATDERPVHDRVLEALKRRALQTIANQHAALDRLAGKIAGSRWVTDDHAAALRADIGAADAGLTELARQIEAAESIPEVEALIRQIDDWKIAQVLAPKTHQVLASDAMVGIGGKAERFAEHLAEVIARFEEAGYDVDEAWRLLEEMQDEIAEAIRLADPVAESVIVLQASDWPDPAQSVLAAGRASLQDAGQSLRSAYGTGKDLVQFLRNLHDGATDA